MQVDPVKPTLKPPGTKRLKLKCDEPLSNFAFNFNLRRYIEQTATTWEETLQTLQVGFGFSLCTMSTRFLSGPATKVFGAVTTCYQT